MLLFAAVCLLAVRAGIQHATPLAKCLLAGLAAGLVCHCFSVFVLPTAFLFYLILGLLFVAGHSERRVPARVALRIPALALSFALCYCAIRLFAADACLAQAQRAIASARISEAGRWYRTSIRWRPETGSPDLDYSKSMHALASTSPVFRDRLDAQQQAFEAAVRAARFAEDRHNAWYHLAILLAERNDSSGVEHALRNASAGRRTGLNPIGRWEGLWLNPAVLPRLWSRGGPLSIGTEAKTPKSAISCMICKLKAAANFYNFFTAWRFQHLAPSVRVISGHLDAYPKTIRHSVSMRSSFWAIP